jgi:hypothetical protein
VHARSFTLTDHSLSLYIAREVEEKQVGGVVGIDRNLRNVTVGKTSRSLTMTSQRSWR